MQVCSQWRLLGAIHLPPLAPLQATVIFPSPPHLPHLQSQTSRYPHLHLHRLHHLHHLHRHYLHRHHHSRLLLGSVPLRFRYRFRCGDGRQGSGGVSILQSMGEKSVLSDAQSGIYNS